MSVELEEVLVVELAEWSRVANKMTAVVSQDVMLMIWLQVAAFCMWEYGHCIIWRFGRGLDEHL